MHISERVRVRIPEFDAVAFAISAIQPSGLCASSASNFVKSLSESFCQQRQFFQGFGSYVSAGDWQPCADIAAFLPERLSLRVFRPTPVCYSPYHVLASRLRAQPGRMIIVDDDWYRVMAAVRAGIRLVIMPHGLPVMDEALGMSARSQTLRRPWLQRFCADDLWGCGIIKAVCDFSHIQIEH